MSSIEFQKLYSLGDVRFSVDKMSNGFASVVDQLFTPASTAGAESGTEIYHYRGNENVRQLIDSVLKLHPKCLWLDAAALITPSGKKILLTGKSGAGKSTTTLGLALKYKWKMVAEDVLLIDRPLNRLVNFSSPSSLKGNAAKLLLETIDIEPAPLIDGEWMLMGKLANQIDYYAPFDVAIHLELINKHDPLLLNRISVAEFCRMVIANTNALRLTNGLSDLERCLETTHCFKIMSGTLTDRMEQIIKLAEDDEYAANLFSTTAAQKILQEQIHFLRNEQFAGTLSEDGSLRVTNETTRLAYHFSQLGSLVYEFCDGTLSPQTMAATISELFPDYEPDTLLTEITQLLAELESHQIIRAK